MDRISSNYYIDIFSRRYWQSLEAEAAAKAEALVAKKQAVESQVGGANVAQCTGERGEEEDDEDDEQEHLNGRRYSGVSAGGSSGDECTWAATVAAALAEDASNVDEAEDDIDLTSECMKDNLEEVPVIGADDNGDMANGFIREQNSDFSDSPAPTFATVTEPAIEPTNGAMPQKCKDV